MFSRRLPGVESLGQVSFIGRVSPNAFSVDPETGFFIPNNQAEDGSRTYLGFIGLYGSDGGFNGLSEGDDGMLHSITKLNDVPREFQTVSWQGKGVGARLWNMPEGPMGMPHPPYNIGAFTLSIPEDGLLDMRGATDNSEVIKQIRRQLAVRLGACTLEDVIEEVGASYGSVAAVLRRMPPQALIHMQERLPHVSWRLRPSFMLVRSPKSSFKMVGQVSLPGFPHKEPKS